MEKMSKNVYKTRMTERGFIVLSSFVICNSDARRENRVMQPCEIVINKPCQIVKIKQTIHLYVWHGLFNFDAKNLTAICFAVAILFCFKKQYMSENIIIDQKH